MRKHVREQYGMLHVGQVYLENCLRHLQSDSIRFFSPGIQLGESLQSTDYLVCRFFSTCGG